MAARVQLIRSREQKEILSWDDKDHPKKTRKRGTKKEARE
jgi:hypothetical protein